MNNKRAVFYFSSIPFGFLRQRPQQLFEAWKNDWPEWDFYYVEPPRSTRLLFSGRENPGEAGVLSGPFSLPARLAIPGKEAINRLLMEKMITNRCGGTGTKVAVVCASLWEPLVSGSLFDLICYDCLDALEVHASPTRFAEMERKHFRLLAKSGILFATSGKLFEDISPYAAGKSLIQVSNGVDYEFFQRSQDAGIPWPQLDGMIVGYVGAIREWRIDFDLIYATAVLMPEAHFLFVGPVSAECAPLVANRPKNVHFVGERPYSEIPAWIRHFDVAVIPFKHSASVEATYPVKLNEYFSLGKPVVATPMRELLPYCDGTLALAADTPALFVEAIRRLIVNQGEHAISLRKEIAQRNSWHSKANTMMTTIDEYLTPRR